MRTNGKRSSNTVADGVGGGCYLVERWSSSKPEGGTPEHVVVETLLSVLVLEGLLPVEGSELQDAPSGPAGEKAEQVAEVGPGLEVMQLGAREQRDEGDVEIGGGVASDEEPVLASDCFPPQGAFGAVVVDGKPAVVEEALERDALGESVADGLSSGRLVEDAPGLSLAPGEESVDDGPGLSPASGESIEPPHARSAPLSSFRSRSRRRLARINVLRAREHRPLGGV
jgi:hypothetical protein